MKRKLIALGIVGPLLLIVFCTAALLFMGTAAWLLAGQENKARVIQILPLAPLPIYEPEPTAYEPEPTAEDEPVVAQSIDSTAEPASVVQSQNEVSTDQADFQPPPANSDLSPAEVEETLGFSLPPGTVNSVTQAGTATRLVIPKLNLDRPILLSPIKNQTWQVDHLGQSVGHLEGTAPPGSNSNMVLAGHVTLAANVYGPFAGLAQLAPGDVVYVYSGDQKFKYIIDNQQTVARTAVEVTYPTDSGQVTLITCNNWNYELGRYQNRLVVRGHLVSS
jgi:LPXTG-site transpeptidase (sortase) family protein